MDVARRTTVTPEGFGEQLRQLRSAASLSQAELARRSGLSTAAVGALERGTRRAPKRETITLLANALALNHSERADLEQAAEHGRARTRTPRPDALAATHNLPYQLTSFVGREDQIEQITRRIESSRLVTVVGSGGVGKTRIALEIGMQLAMNATDEVRLIDLAPLQSGIFITSRIAGVLDIELSDMGDSPESLASALKTRRVLLVLDNCEHLIADATKTIRALLQGCPNVRILATTRERLGIMGEVVHRLSPLALPDDNRLTIANARSASAVELFLQRTHSADPDVTFTDRDAATLIDVCRRLQGIPLAIELVAAQVPTLGLETLSRRLEAALEITRSTRSIPDRQQTMHDTIAWSHDLLTDPERLLLRRLGIFAAGCTLAAAESVCAETDLQVTHVAGLLASLVDKSLVNAVIEGEHMRYVLLDSTRAFVRERLAEAEEESTFSRRHAEWLAAYGEHVAREYLAKPNLVWLNEFVSEIDNVRSALEWALRSELDDDVLLAGQITGSFRGLWLIQGWFGECRRWITLVLERIDETQQPLVVASLLTALAQTLAGPEALAVWNHLIIVLRRHLNDRLRLASTLAALGAQYCHYGSTEKAQNAIDEAHQILVEERTPGTPSFPLDNIKQTLLATSLKLSVARGQFAEARAYLEEAMALGARLGDEYYSTSLVRVGAELEFVAGDPLLAAKYSVEAVRLAEAIPRAPEIIAWALCVDAAIRLSTADSRRGKAAARRAFDVVVSLEDTALRLISLQNLAAVAAHSGRWQTGARFLGSIEVWRETAKYQRSLFEEATCKVLIAALHAQLGADTETHMAEGRRLNADVSAAEVLLIDFRDNVDTES